MNLAPTAVAFRAIVKLGGKTAAGIERVVAVSPDLVDALPGKGETGRRFADLSRSSQRRFVLGIEGVKTGETRRRRIARTVETLRADLI